MDSAGMVVSSIGREVDVLVSEERVELGSILKIGEYYGIVAGMEYREDEKIGSKQKLIAKTQVFGKLEDSRLKRIKKPIPPYTDATLADKTELEKILKAEETISIGNVLGTNARAYFKASEFDRHTAILASTGSGKSYTAANLIKEYVTLGLPVVVIDTHGEYQKLLGKLLEGKPQNIKTYTVKYVRQGAEQLKIPVNDLAASDFTHFISLTEPQQTAVEQILDKLAGDEYLVDDMIAAADKLDNTVFHEGTIAALKRKLTSLKRAFADVFDKYGTDTSKLVKPDQVTIIDASLAPQPVRRSIVSYIAKELLRGRVNNIMELGEFRIQNPLLLVVEEAHNYAGGSLSHSCKREIIRVASEGRKFGVGLCVISQKPSKIDEEILSQCNTGIYMHITNPRDKDHIRKTFESINDAIIADLDSLDVGESIIAGACLDIPFLLCTVDRIELKEKKKTKFDFKRKKELKVGGLDYT